MPLIKFAGGPHDGETRDIPQATGGAPVLFRRESGTTVYEFTGSYQAGARVYRVKDAPVPVVTEWPEEAAAKKTPRPRNGKKAGKRPEKAAHS